MQRALPARRHVCRRSPTVDLMVFLETEQLPAHGRKKRGHCISCGAWQEASDSLRGTPTVQTLTVSTQDSCSAARARLAVATNRLSHRERRLERAGTSNWQEELKDGGGAQPAAAANQGRVFSTTRSSFGAGVGRPHAPSSSPCGARMAALMRWTADENTCPWCRSPSCQLILG